MPARYSQKIEGLCGNFNQDPYDDRILRNGQVLERVKKLREISSKISKLKKGQKSTIIFYSGKFMFLKNTNQNIFSRIL